MGWRFKKSFRVLPGVRVNVSNKGVGGSVGVPGYRKGRTASGKSYTTVSVPGTGLSNTTFHKGKQAPPTSSPQPERAGFGAILGAVALALVVVWGLSVILG